RAQAGCRQSFEEPTLGSRRGGEGRGRRALRIGQRRLGGEVYHAVAVLGLGERTTGAVLEALPEQEAVRVQGVDREIARDGSEDRVGLSRVAHLFRDPRVAVELTLHPIPRAPV